MNSTLLSQGFAHSYADDDIDGPLGHFHNEKVLELFRRIMLFFQQKIPGLKMPAEPFNPASLVVPAAFVRLFMFVAIHKTYHPVAKLAAHLRLYLSGQRIPGIRNLAEPQTFLDRDRTVRLCQLVIRILESDKAHILVSLMDKETHSLSSDLEPTQTDQYVLCFGLQYFRNFMIIF